MNYLIEDYNSDHLIKVNNDDENFNMENYSMWIFDGKEYTPSLKLKIKKTLPKGIYKIDYEEGKYFIGQIKNNTDEIYKLSNKIVNTILTEIDDFWNKKDLYEKHHILHKRGLLLEGPAGNSKTSTINLIIENILNNDGLIFIVRSLREFNLLCDFLPIFRQIEPNRNVITIIEDIDQLIDMGGGFDINILDFLDGKNSINHHLVIMTSNNTTRLSEALLRPSRIDVRFILELPDKQTRYEYLEKKGISKDRLNEYAEKTNGMTFAQLKELFISTEILNKDIDTAINKIMHPLETKDYLSNNLKVNKIGI